VDSPVVSASAQATRKRSTRTAAAREVLRDLCKLPATLARSRGGGGWDRPEAACPPDSRPPPGAAGGFNAVQKLLTNPALSSLVGSRAPLAGSTPGRSSPRRDDTLAVSRTLFKSGNADPLQDPSVVDGRGHSALEHQLGRHVGAVIAVSCNLASGFEVELD